MLLFWIFSLLLLLLGILFIAAPLFTLREKKGRTFLLMILFILPIVVFAGYWHWGNYQAFAVNNLLKSGKDYPPNKLVHSLEIALRKQPENYRAWYLLGEGWMASRQFSNAASAFEKAAAITDDSPEPLAKYAQALFLANNRQITPKIESLINKVIIQNPEDRTALGLQGIAAFEQKKYKQAISIWEKLLTLTISEESKKFIRSGIIKAKQLESSSEED